jgi:hypothetical protein
MRRAATFTLHKLRLPAARLRVAAKLPLTTVGSWPSAGAGERPVRSTSGDRISSVRKRTNSGADEPEIDAMLDTVVRMIVGLAGEPVDVQKDSAKCESIDLASMLSEHQPRIDLT